MQALGKAEFWFHLGYWVAGTESCCHYCIEHHGMLFANLACTAIVVLMMLLLLWVPRGRWSQCDSQPHSLPHRIPPMKSGATSLHLSQRAKRVPAQDRSKQCSLMELWTSLDKKGQNQAGQWWAVDGVPSTELKERSTNRVPQPASQAVVLKTWSVFSTSAPGMRNKDKAEALAQSLRFDITAMSGISPLGSSHHLVGWALCLQHPVGWFQALQEGWAGLKRRRGGIMCYRRVRMYGAHSWQWHSWEPLGRNQWTNK